MRIRTAEGMNYPAPPPIPINTGDILENQALNKAIEGLRAHVAEVRAKAGDADTGASAADPTTGGGASALLAMESMGTALIDEQQRNSETGVPSAVKHTLDQITADSGFAREKAYELAHAKRAVCTRTPFDGTPESAGKMASWEQTLESVRQKKIALYNDEIAKGTPPDQIYAKLMKLEASQSQDYWDALDPDHQLGDLQAAMQSNLAYFERGRRQTPESEAA